MTPGQIAEGQRRSANFVPRKVQTSDSGKDEIPRIDERRGAGTGFFVTEDGVVLTAAHVIHDAQRIIVQTRKGSFPATVLTVDAANDVAVIKVGGSFSALPVLSSREVKLGANVFTMGFPNPDIQGLSPKLTKGDISGLAGLRDDPRHFQISVPIQPGNSGGPLVDSFGNVVGLIVNKLNDAAAAELTGTLPQTVNYAVKSHYVLGVLDAVPGASGKMKTPRASAESFDEIVQAVQAATVLVLVY